MSVQHAMQENEWGGLENSWVDEAWSSMETADALTRLTCRASAGGLMSKVGAGGVFVAGQPSH